MNKQCRPLVHIATACIVCCVATAGVRTQGQIVWFADHEEPGEFDWYRPGGVGFGGAKSDSGCSSDDGAGWAGTSLAVWKDIGIPSPINGGEFGLMLTSLNSCNTDQSPSARSAGTRMFRWKEPRWDYPNQALYYKVWFYFPQNYRLIGSPNWWFWNIVQWKSRTDVSSDVFFSLNIYNRPNGAMVFALRDAQGCQCTLDPLATIDVPINEWFYVEAYYNSQALDVGQVRIWQGNAASRTLLYDLSGVRTKYPGGDTSWSVNNYSSGLAPQPAYFFIDNAEIRTP